MIDDTSVPIDYVRSLVLSATEHGCDRASLLADAGITQEELDNALYFSALKYGQLYNRVMQLTQDETFGMFTGGKVKIGSFRLMCLTLFHCDDLRQAILRLAAFAEVCRGFRIKQRLSEQGMLARITVAPLSDTSEEEFEQLAQAASAVQIRTLLSMWHRVNCWLVGQEIPITTMYLTCDETSFSSLAETYPQKVLFNQSFNGFEFPVRFLDYPMVQNQETLMEFLRTAPYHLVVSDSIQQNIKNRVRGILSKDVSVAMPNADEVAQRLNISVTTLRRKLQAEDSSFQKLKDECRMEAAFHYLSCPDFTNTMIAERLGFDDTSAFFRAFKKWTGVTPGEYRKQLAEERG